MSTDAEDQILINPNKHKTPCFTYVLSILSAVGGFLFGYDTGVVSGAMLLIRDYFNLNSLWESVLVSCTIGFAALFSLIGGLCADKFGRKKVILAASVIFTIGGILMGASNTKEELLGGRCLVGAAIGLASMAVPMYISEASPMDKRGMLVTLNNCCITLGQLVASIVDGLFSHDPHNGWRYMLGLAAVPSIIQFFGFLFMPESPRWLVTRKRYEEAAHVLHKVRGQTTDISKELEEIRQSCLEDEENRQAQKARWIIVDILKQPTLRYALFVGCSLQLFQQLAGINTVMYYSATIIEMSGLAGSDTSKIIWLAAIPSAVNSASSLLGLLYVEKMGRRKLTLFSLLGVILSLAMLSVSFYLIRVYSPAVSQHLLDTSCSHFSSCFACTESALGCGFCYSGSNSTCEPRTNITGFSAEGFCAVNSTANYTWAKDWCPTSYGVMALVGLVLYLVFFAPGMGPMPWTINSEIYPLWARSTCYSISTAINWVSNFFVSMTFLLLTEALTKHGAFAFYTALAILGFIIFFFFLPETRGVSLEKVESLFKRFWWQSTTEDLPYVTIEGKDMTTLPPPPSEPCDHMHHS